MNLELDLDFLDKSKFKSVKNAFNLAKFGFCQVKDEFSTPNLALINGKNAKAKLKPTRNPLNLPNHVT